MEKKEKCGRTLRTYKRICNKSIRVEKFDVNTLSISELQFYMNKITDIINTSIECRQLRIKYKFECISKEDRDVGHDKKIDQIGYIIRMYTRKLAMLTNKLTGLLNLQTI